MARDSFERIRGDMTTNKGGVLLSPEDSRDWRIDRCLDIPAGGAAEGLPRTFSVSWLPPITDQGRQQTCTAHAMALILSCIYYKLYHEELIFSKGFIYGNRLETEYQGPGQIMRDVVKSVHKHGDIESRFWDNELEVPEAIEAFLSVYPELKDLAHKLVQGYVRIRDEDEAKAFLVRYDIPLFVCARMRYVNPLTRSDDYHALACTGWLRSGVFKHQNSWGKLDCPRPEIEYDNISEIYGVIPMEELKFPDIEPGRWSEEAIYNQVKKGTLKGFPDGTFRPTEPITREQAAVILERLDRLEGK